MDKCCLGVNEFSVEGGPVANELCNTSVNVDKGNPVDIKKKVNYHGVTD